MTMIPLNSLARHVEGMQAAISRAAVEVIASGHYVLGPRVVAFERDFAAYCGVSHCVGVANGTDALELALKAVGVAPGDTVAVAANAAMYGTSAALAAGARVAFVDVEPCIGTLDPSGLRRLLESEPAPKAVIVTHLYGRLARMDEILRLARDAGVRVVEDCAQAHGARSADGRRAGALGDVASFSFYPTKNLGALGDGGAIVTDDAGIAAQASRLRQYGWTAKYTNTVPGGRNSRLDEIQAAMLSVMLPMLDGWNERRRLTANRYSQEIQNPRIQVPPVAGEDYVAHLYVVCSPERDALRTHLTACGVQSEPHYPAADHRQPCHGGRFADIVLPVTEMQCEQVLSLPCFPEITDEEVESVIDACNRF